MKKKQGTETQLAHLGRNPDIQQGYVSPPVYRGSTAVYKNMDQMKESLSDPLKNRFPTYGRFGSPASRSLEEMLSELEGGFGTVTTGTGLAAITTSILSLVKAGDHILVVDSVYWPTRNFCESLKNFGVVTEYYDPRMGYRIETLFRPQTRFVFMESPGSLTFEVQDIPSIVKVCRARGIKTLIDNTWATPLFFKPLSLGVDLSIHSGTKYICGHSDGFLGVIICNEETYPIVRTQCLNLGQWVSGEDVFLALRGLRTLSVRLQQHQLKALHLAKWLETREEVLEVLHPGLESHPDHNLWKRDYQGSSGLFSFILKPKYSEKAVENFIQSLNLFGLGQSWGGFESLILSSDPGTFRSPNSWKTKGPLIRLHVGLENVEDLIQDLEMGFNELMFNSI